MRVFILAPPALNQFEQSVLAPFTAGKTHTACGCAIDVRPGKPLLKRLFDNLRRGRGGYVLVMALKLVVRERGGSTPTRDFCERHGVPVLETTAPFSAETAEAIRAQSPDVLVLVGGFGIVRSPLLELAPYGVLSYHHGDMRRYRGQPPAFWELYHGEREMGVTVQRLSEHLDAGEPIVECRVEIRPNDTLRALYSRAMEASVPMLYQAVETVAKPEFRSQTIDSLGPLYTLPNLRQWLVLNAKIVGRRLRTPLRLR
jgi:folate-dependent phosphoribosylglycinamide formyltransferase PurN